MYSRSRFASTLLTVLLLTLTGCPHAFEDVNIEVNKGDEIITDAPADFDLAADVLLPDAVIVEDVSAIPVAIVPDITVLTFDNFTDFDLVITYFVEGDPQTVLVPFDSLVSIEYDPCLGAVQLDFEDDFDPVTGLYLGSFDLSDVFLEEGVDYLCGDEIFFTFEPDALVVTADPLL